jgi:hypothetical protein
LRNVSFIVAYDYEIWRDLGLAVVHIQAATLHHLTGCATRIRFDADSRSIQNGLVDLGSGPARMKVDEIDRLAEFLLGLEGSLENRWAVLTRHPQDTALAILLQRGLWARRRLAVFSGEDEAAEFLKDCGVPPGMARYLLLTEARPTAGHRVGPNHFAGVL